jgi:hypothetical protein
MPGSPFTEFEKLEARLRRGEVPWGEPIRQPS